MFEVKSRLIDVAPRWWDIGLALGINDPLLETIKAEHKTDPENCLTAMLRLWLKRSYDTERYGTPSWQRLSEAVRHPAGGNDPALAYEISQMWDFEHMSTSSR